MVHASLFTGIGGFDLAAEWMGWQNSFQCEIDPFCQKVLAKNFPDADRYTDIKHFNATRYRGTVDVLSGGFPCQPFSLAGQRKGNQDDRALWPEMLRVIDEVRPRWIVGENVAGLVSLGLDGVLFDLEASGYTVQTVLLPACSVGAPHQRDRLWIIAHARSSGRIQYRQGHALPECKRDGSNAESGREQLTARLGGGNEIRSSANACSGGCSTEQLELCWRQSNTTGGLIADALSQRGRVPPSRQQPAKQWIASSGQNRQASQGFRLSEPPLCGPDDGLPAGLVRVSTRAKQLKAYGNSIVPQVAYEIFQALAAYTPA